jgi:hypothetical protein
MRAIPLISAVILLVGLAFVYNQAVGDKPEAATQSIAPAVSQTGSTCGTTASGCPKQAQAQAQWTGCSKSKTTSTQSSCGASATGCPKQATTLAAACAGKDPAKCCGGCSKTQ